MLGVLAAIAIPRITAPNERILSAEGRQTLIAILSAQKRYELENGALAAQITDLDFDIPASNYFNPPSVPLGGIGQVQRTGGAYTLTIDASGVITCAGGGTNCAQIRCNMGGGGNQCN